MELINSIDSQFLIKFQFSYEHPTTKELVAVYHFFLFNIPVIFNLFENKF